MLLSLFLPLVLLGLAAIDPIGIAVMPILLLRQQPFRRSFTFLGGSFVALMVMGLLFAQGLGTIVLRFEQAHSWFVPSIEAVAGLVLLGLAGIMFWRAKTGTLPVEPSKTMVRRLQLGDWQLFLLGAALVAVQSVADVVFVLAMIRIGQLRLSTFMLSIAVATYAIAALVLQLSVIVSFKLAPLQQRAKRLDMVRSLLEKYANQAVVGVSLLLGFGLLILAIR